MTGISGYDDMCMQITQERGINLASEIFVTFKRADTQTMEDCSLH